MGKFIVTLFKIEKLNTKVTWLIDLLTLEFGFERSQAVAETAFYFSI